MSTHYFYKPSPLPIQNDPILKNSVERELMRISIALGQISEFLKINGMDLKDYIDSKVVTPFHPTFYHPPSGTTIKFGNNDTHWTVTGTFDTTKVKVGDMLLVQGEHGTHPYAGHNITAVTSTTITTNPLPLSVFDDSVFTVLRLTD